MAVARSRWAPAAARVGLVCLIGIDAAMPAAGSSEVKGAVSVFKSPGGVGERCVVLARMPGAIYRDSEAREEAGMCEINFYAGSHALCPKLFSTSAGTLVHDLRGGAYAGQVERFEHEVCPRGHVVAREAADVPVSFKMSVNTRETSATFANSALIYYHYARYFDAAIHVPAAVLRTMDRMEHRTRVAAAGARESAGRPALHMNHAAWTTLAQAEQQPESYTSADELFTADRRAVYGVMLHPRGRQYGEEFNGSRSSGWGDGQSRDFQETPPFVALRSSQPLAGAIEEGLRRGHAAAAIPAAVREVQMVFWMRDLVDITLLDYLFGQQDRIGNIDYLTYWYWVEGGQVRRMPAQGAHRPDELAAFAPKLITRTELGDNDAGVRLSYLNFTKRTGMLEALRHYNAATYAKLMALDQDFAANGPLWSYTRDSFGLSDVEFRRIAGNVRDAAAILRAACRAGRLRFDLEPEAFLRDGTVAERAVDCGKP
jgi:hypothetical protein